MIYLQLFLAFLQIGAFSFGGGYAAMPLIREQVILHYGWLSEADFANLVTISEMTPGPIAINGATFVGNQVAGILGALAATAGCVLPSCVFVSLLALLYKKYHEMPLLKGVLGTLRPAVVSMILAAGLGILIPTIFTTGTVSFVAGNVQWRFVLYFIGCLVLLRKWKLNPILVMVISGVCELGMQCVLRFAG
ncbi:MAG: chromate transporter [Lachnospiraceae bacterium]|nr:chromate transporter [Lachnospiraceae bacterium]